MRPHAGSGMTVVQLPGALNALGSRIIGAAIAVHRELGPGLLEGIYETCLTKELDLAGLRWQRQVVLPIHYKGQRLDSALRLDLLVEDAVVLEVKAVETLLPVHEAQLLTYLRLTAKRLGYILNFNVPVMRQCIRRIAH